MSRKILLNEHLAAA